MKENQIELPYWKTNTYNFKIMNGSMTRENIENATQKNKVMKI